MILTAPREGTCDFPLWTTELLCDREPGHVGAHVYRASAGAMDAEAPNDEA